MKVLVTGGAGFIGSHLCEKLLNEGHKVTAYDNLLLGRREFLSQCERSENFQFLQEDLLNLDILVSVMKGHDLVFHMAANSDISQGAKQTDVDLKNGTFATYNVLEAMRLNQVKNLVFASSSAIYGEADVMPTPENYGPLMPISLYGASKLACEALCTAFAHNFNINIWMYRFANIVGSHSTHGVIYDFVDKLKKDSKSLHVLGDGSQRKSYLHVSDCVDGMLYGYKNLKNECEVLNLASRGVTNVKFIAEEVVRQMAARSGNKAELHYGEGQRGWRGDVPYTHLEGAKFEKLGWSAKMTSDEAVVLAVQEIISEKMG
ncbi:MAG: UDP-glucose 4-epimerase [Bdellovibrionales bacterium CG10_big_fil_rev_8_21_14_0_10_45_34]|nr:MAG: UDP-glucose 4-epimerase [Bdellovibrionales bacterium CG10_big_fil_rev_8_21_14_0_10_45_34]